MAGAGGLQNGSSSAGRISSTLRLRPAAQQAVGPQPIPIPFLPLARASSRKVAHNNFNKTKKLEEMPPEVALEVAEVVAEVVSELVALASSRCGSTEA